MENKQLLEELKTLREYHGKVSNILHDTILKINGMSAHIENLHSILEKCPKCGSSGWVWYYELDLQCVDEDYNGNDDNKYTCDKCNGIGYINKQIEEE